ncbi:hypothetical protein [Lactococcus lactis]|uniref:hypothetical protein n=1 Tax=Lactococcus lactis TaxID=1358 RepID=UPI00191412BD|nr:hypothetical protein [Lactococcus lactis]WDA67437.1 hypothetical protein IL310_01340 [Lactococcus lactis]WDA67492.1 hypothetical protein IL310_01035 [Lactococcus lactis]
MEKTIKLSFSAISIAVFIQILLVYSDYPLLEFGRIIGLIVTSMLFVMANKSIWEMKVEE